MELQEPSSSSKHNRSNDLQVSRLTTLDIHQLDSIILVQVLEVHDLALLIRSPILLTGMFLILVCSMSMADKAKFLLHRGKLGR